jgi:phosphodiesterase/alkaline phosphatase D-like protein
MRAPGSVHPSLSRRRFVQGAAAAGLLSPRALLAQSTPWAQRPSGNPQRLTFVVWQYGKIYEQIAK